MALLDKLKRELKEAISRMNAALEFADLEEVKDRWGILRLTTGIVNKRAKNFEIRPECDCCNGVTVYALPYIEFQGVRLYGKTPAISFAKKYVAKDITFYVAEDYWDEKEEFNGPLLDKIEAWLDEHDFIGVEDVDDEFDQPDAP